MPTYEYECIKCKHTLEAFQKITDRPLKKCPECDGRLRRIITGGVGVIFKGNGFYITDYKKSNLPQPSEKKKKDLKIPEKEPKQSPKTSPE